MLKIDYDMPEDQYHNDPLGDGIPRLSSSIAATLVMKSPAHAYAEHPLLGGQPRDRTDAMTEGGIIDALIFGGKRIVELPYDDFRKKDAQEERDAAIAAGCIPVISKKLTAYKECANSMLESIARFGIDLASYKRQVSIFWDEIADDDTSVPCKARLDALSLTTIFDLKKTRSAHPATLAKHIVGYGYDIQSAAYKSCVRHADLIPGKLSFSWIFVEAAPPYAVSIAVPSGALNEFGKSRWRRAVNLWSQCVHSKNWPAYQGITRVELPTWVMDEEMAEAVSEVEDDE